ncbi:hypothetical protein G6L37_34765 [Agrobacterium rubi]|nr:hypothetical protein [Agrobacterium rubi]NTF23731.1 hypothetical protein [Agrobacterium rubi]
MSHDHHLAGPCDGISMHREGSTTTIRFRSEEEAAAFDQILRDSIYARADGQLPAPVERVPDAWRCSRMNSLDGNGKWHYYDGPPNPSHLAKNVQTLYVGPPPSENVSGGHMLAELSMTAFETTCPERDELNGEQTILTYNSNVGTWDLAFFESGEEFPEKWFGDTHWIDITAMWPGVIAQVTGYVSATEDDQ